VSPHNEDIEKEFAAAFSLDHAGAHGQTVEVQYRNIGGSNDILRYLRNVYSASSTAEIDILWGGGEYVCQVLATEGILQPMKLSDDALANIPAAFGGLEMYDPQFRWCGTAISGFGFLYRRDLLKQLALEPPKAWDDLGDPKFRDLIALADPMQSGSAASAYEMIVQSAPTWPEGWAKLLAILGNVKRFYEGASGAADAPELGEAALATAIDFYGTTRVAKMPDKLAYVSPRGQTAFSPDPIAVLKNPPSPQLAQRFVDFVLSRRGQALWAVRPGETDGPVHNALGRQPIRKDVYEAYAGKMSAWIINPYEAGNEMQLDVQMREVRFGVLRQLVRAAAIDNLDGLRKARKKLIETNFPADRLATFNELPANVRTRQDIAAAAEALKDTTAAERITTDWRRYFREKYQALAE
ncbi:MAG TPA: extracellular solute-binding protein, partial [Phycisphaerae bacterium]|nr:extracellular solute-binding protein [Phycisphaerae bacterium]